MPAVSDDSALLKMEAAGICGTDVKFYAKPPITDDQKYPPWLGR